MLRLGYERLDARCAIPRRVDEVGAEYLGGLLGQTVRSARALGGTEGTTDRVRLALEGDDVPESVFVKMAAAAPVTRLFGNLARLGEDEVGFYREIRPELAIEAPEVFGLAQDPRTQRFVLVLEDLEARGCTFPRLVDAFDLASAEAAVETLARLHASFWGSPRLARTTGPGHLGWIRMNGSDPLLPLVNLALTSFARRLRRDDPDLVPADGRTILDRYRAIARQLDEGPMTILHGDPHPGNWYFDGERAGLLDWQVIRRGNAIRDVTYFLVLALEPESRREHERALLDRYRDSLADAGGPNLDADETWTAHRQMAAYPYVAATFTAGLGGLQSDDTARSGLRRAVAAILDLDTRAALD